MKLAEKKTEMLICFIVGLDGIRSALLFVVVGPASIPLKTITPERGVYVSHRRVVEVGCDMQDLIGACVSVACNSGNIILDSRTGIGMLTFILTHDSIKRTDDFMSRTLAPLVSRGARRIVMRWYRNECIEAIRVTGIPAITGKVVGTWDCSTRHVFKCIIYEPIVDNVGPEIVLENRREQRFVEDYNFVVPVIEQLQKNDTLR